MNEYRVTLESKDGQKFQTDVISQTDEDAVQFAMLCINEKGWDMYHYSLKQLERLK